MNIRYAFISLAIVTFYNHDLNYNYILSLISAIIILLLIGEAFYNKTISINFDKYENGIKTLLSINIAYSIYVIFIILLSYFSSIDIGMLYNYTICFSFIMLLIAIIICKIKEYYTKHRSDLTIQESIANIVMSVIVSVIIYAMLTNVEFQYTTDILIKYENSDGLTCEDILVTDNNDDEKVVVRKAQKKGDNYMCFINIQTQHKELGRVRNANMHRKTVRKLMHFAQIKKCDITVGDYKLTSDRYYMNLKFRFMSFILIITYFNILGLLLIKKR